jgi:tight adherence protein B
VTENGEPVEIEVNGLSDEAIDVVLVMDVSGSMAGEPMTQAKAAATAFVDELPDSAELAIVSFGNDAQVVSDFTSDRNASRSEIAALDDGGETALYDGVTLAADQLRGSDAARSAMVVLSDGGDTVSDGTLESASAALQDLDADFYAVSLQSGETDEAALAALASAAEGQVVPATDPAALSEAYVDLGQRIANQYELVFQSVTAEPTGTFEVTVLASGDADSIEVALPDRGGVTATTEAAAPQAPPERLITTGETDVLEKDWVMWVGAALIGIAVTITLWAVAPTGPRTRRRSLASDRAGAHDDIGTGERIVGSVRGVATRLSDRAVERSERGGAIDEALDRAGLVMRAGEFVALVAGVAIAAAIVLGLLMGPVGIVVGALVPIFGAPAFLRFMASRRNAKFGEQLGDTLMLMAGSLRSGFGIGQSIDSVAQEMPDPIGGEFQRALLEMRLGREIDDALESVARRVQNEDFEWVVDAIRINKQVGGNLAEILDQVAETIRARNRLRRQISALTAEGRLSGIVLAALPIVMAMVLYTTNPDYLSPMFSRTAGQIMLGFGIGLLITGGLWLKKLVNVEL